MSKGQNGNPQIGQRSLPTLHLNKSNTLYLIKDSQTTEWYSVFHMDIFCGRVFKHTQNSLLLQSLKQILKTLNPELQLTNGINDNEMQMINLPSGRQLPELGMQQAFLLYKKIYQEQRLLTQPFQHPGRCGWQMKRPNL